MLASMFHTRSAGRTRAVRRSLPWPDQTGRLAVRFLVDRVGRFQLEEFIGCTYLPLARVVEDPDIIRDAEGHVDFGTNASAEFAAKGGEFKERIQKAVEYWYVKGLDMFGNSKSYRSERYMF